MFESASCFLLRPLLWDLNTLGSGGEQWCHVSVLVIKYLTAEMNRAKGHKKRGKEKHNINWDRKNERIAVGKQRNIYKTGSLKSEDSDFFMMSRVVAFQKDAHWQKERVRSQWRKKEAKMERMWKDKYTVYTNCETEAAVRCAANRWSKCGKLEWRVTDVMIKHKERKERR